MQWFVLTGKWLAILASDFTFFYGALATYNNLGASLLLHCLQSIPSWTNEQTHEINIGMLFLRNKHFVTYTCHGRLIICRRFKFRIYVLHFLYQLMALLFQAFAEAKFTRV